VKPAPSKRTLVAGVARRGVTSTSSAVTSDSAVTVWAGLPCSVTVTVNDRRPRATYGAGREPAGRAPAASTGTLGYRISASRKMSTSAPGVKPDPTSSTASVPPGSGLTES